MAFLFVYFFFSSLMSDLHVVGGWMAGGGLPQMSECFMVNHGSTNSRRHGVCLAAAGGRRMSAVPERGRIRTRSQVSGGWAPGKRNDPSPNWVCGERYQTCVGGGGCCLSGQLLHCHSRVWLPLELSVCGSITLALTVGSGSGLVRFTLVFLSYLRGNWSVHLDAGCTKIVKRQG